MTMYHRFSNTVLGYLNLLTLLASIPIIAAGLWMARSSTTCDTFLQTPLLAIGFVVLIISLAGFVGACFNVVWALWLYLAAMLLLLGSLLGILAFGFAVTSGGGGAQVPGRPYREYRLGDYSSWMRAKVGDPTNWKSVQSCIMGSKQCAKIAAWTPLDYMERSLTPIQSGCCKPPTSCTYTGDSPALPGVSVAASTAGPPQQDCYRWSNAPGVLCYACDSCKAAVLEDARKAWHKLSVLLIVVLVLLVGVYSLGCCAFRNAKRSDSDYPYGENRVYKVRPRWDFYWWRRWHDWRNQVF